jgi:arginase
VGLRSLDPPERERVRASEATAFTMTDIDHRGIAAVVADAIDVVADGVESVHLILDLDSLLPPVALRLLSPAPGGVTYREAHTALELLAERDADDGLLRSMDVVEVNPILDARNETAPLAAELIASALGKRIL